MSSWKSSKEGDLPLCILQKREICAKPLHDINFVHQYSNSGWNFENDEIFPSYNSLKLIIWCRTFLCRLRSIATHRDHFVRRPSVCLSVRLSVCPSVTPAELCFAGDTCIPRNAATILYYCTLWILCWLSNAFSLQNSIQYTLFKEKMIGRKWGSKRGMRLKRGRFPLPGGRWMFRREMGSKRGSLPPKEGDLTCMCIQSWSVKFTYCAIYSKAGFIHSYKC